MFRCLLCGQTIDDGSVEWMQKRVEFRFHSTWFTIWHLSWQLSAILQTNPWWKRVQGCFLRLCRLLSANFHVPKFNSKRFRLQTFHKVGKNSKQSLQWKVHLKLPENLICSSQWLMKNSPTFMINFQSCFPFANIMYAKLRKHNIYI